MCSRTSVALTFERLGSLKLTFPIPSTVDGGGTKGSTRFPSINHPPEAELPNLWINFIFLANLLREATGLYCKAAFISPDSWPNFMISSRPKKRSTSIRLSNGINLGKQKIYNFYNFHFSLLILSEKYERN